MKELFHIINNNPENVQRVLSMRLGEKHASFVITDKSGNELNELAYCSVEDWNDNILTDFFNQYPSIHHPFYQVFVAYDFPQSILMPSSVYQSGEAQLFLKSTHGTITGSQTVSELIPEWQLYNTYSVPDEISKWIKEKYPSAKTMHQYSLGVKKISAAGQEGILSVDFRKDDLTILVAGNSRLLLSQSFPYKTPEDVLYYLLKSCSQFSFSQQEVNVQLSGLIEKESSLYKELYQYFINLEFREAAWKTGNEYPAHYFTSLNDLARCAS